MGAKPLFKVTSQYCLFSRQCVRERPRGVERTFAKERRNVEVGLIGRARTRSFEVLNVCSTPSYLRDPVLSSSMLVSCSPELYL
jgi:hypothetical protein